jgi:hypothetical protein
MADDDRKEDSAPDPWADILADNADEPQPELSFSEPVAAEQPPAPPADDEAADGSSIEIGTGRSGIVAAEEVDAWGEMNDDEEAGRSGADDPAANVLPFTAVAEDAAADAFLDEALAADADADAADREVSSFAMGTEEEEPDFGIAAVGDDPAAAATLVGAAAAAGAVAAPSAPRKAANPTKAKQGGIGQIIGLVLGGAMAFPIVFGILVGLMWAGVNVPVGKSIGQALPESMAFLVPEKYRPGYRKPAANLAQAARLDDLSAVEQKDGVEPEDSAASSPDALAGSTPMPDPTAEPVVDDMPVVPSDGETFDDPLEAAAVPVANPAAPAFDPELAAAEARRLAAEAAAADRKPLDAAVEQALTAIATVEEVADVEDPARKPLLVDCYKSLAKVAAELVMLERISGDAGRPLVETPESVVGLHDRLARHREDLVRLGRNWLDFQKRPSDGVWLPVTFQSARKVGPYWSAKVTLALPKGATRELTVLSRAEPAAVQGDAVVLAGLLLDGDVIWAADVRPLPADNRGLF